MAIKAGTFFAVTGINELDQKLAEMETKLRDKYIRKATRQAAKAVLAHAKRLVPENTGQLAASLKVRSASTGYKSKEGKRKRISKYRGLIGHGVVAGEGVFQGDQFYAGFVEFGTKDRWTKSALWKDPKQTGKAAFRGRIDSTKWAFLRPALYAEEQNTRAIFQIEMARFVMNEGKAVL